MSWVAAAKPVARQMAPITQTVSGLGGTPASHRPVPSRATWPSRIHPRLRPRMGSGYRSVKGDHRNLKLQGAWASVKRPTTLMSTPACAIHVGIAIHTRPSGRPEENERSETERSRQLRATDAMLCQVSSRLFIDPRHSSTPPIPRRERAGLFPQTAPHLLRGHGSSIASALQGGRPRIQWPSRGRCRVAIVVQKYGGSSVADVDKIRKVADRVATTKAAGRDVVVVVSAMGDTTDELLALAKKLTDSPARRELDMLHSAGERISMALLSMALNARGVPAVSFTGSQSGIVTNDSHTNARIVEVRPFRVQDELERGKVVIVAGYQGVSYKREVTTLGRGGSDTTAVALAAALDAEACEIYSDVEGVYTADPRVVPDARRLAELSYEEMQELAESGAKVLNAQAVEFAKERGIAIYARATRGGAETVVRKSPPRAPGRVVGVASETGLVALTTADQGPDLLFRVLEHLDGRQVAGKQFHLDVPDRAGVLSLVLSLENLHDFPLLRQH